MSKVTSFLGLSVVECSSKKALNLKQQMNRLRVRVFVVFVFKWSVDINGEILAHD